MTYYRTAAILATAGAAATHVYDTKIWIGVMHGQNYRT